MKTRNLITNYLSLIIAINITGVIRVKRLIVIDITGSQF